MDDLVGRTMAKCAGTDTLLMVLSDHGFTTFRRGIDLNRWLEENGYLVVDDAPRGEEHLAGVDWSQDAGLRHRTDRDLHQPVKDKFAHGIVAAGEEAETLRDGIAERARRPLGRSGRTAAARDPARLPGDEGLSRALQGTGAGPDRRLRHRAIASPGMRLSAERRTAIFHDNTKAWSGDHCVDPSVVPGVLFCNQPIQAENPRLLDIAPTVLDLFGVPRPTTWTARSLTSAKRPKRHGTPGRRRRPRIRNQVAT